MRRFAIAAALGLSVLSAPASAQAPAAVIASSWTGLYVGGHAGGAWIDDFSSQFSGAVIAGFPFVPASHTGSGLGAVAGGHLGYNWQFHSNWLVGVEGDWSFASLSGGNTISPTSIFFPGPTLLTGSQTTARADVRNLATARGRLGYVASNWMIYGTGGVAWAEVDYNASFSCPPVVPPPGQVACGGAFFGTASANKTHTGWVAGAGLEHKSAGSPLVFGVEYLYYDFDSATTLASPITVGGGNAVWAFNDLDIHVVRVRLSYKVW
jgi:outer membrane immunogenic protein